MVVLHIFCAWELLLPFIVAPGTDYNTIINKRAQSRASINYVSLNAFAFFYLVTFWPRI